MAKRINRREFPCGREYQVVTLGDGIVVVGSENEPIVRIIGTGFHAVYKLISLTIDEERSDFLSLTEKDGILVRDQIENWIEKNIQTLHYEANLHGFVRFLPNYPCYYNLQDNRLYHATGYKGKNSKNPINGKPFKFGLCEESLLKYLIQTPGYGQQFEDVMRNASIPNRGTLETTWNHFCKHDKSIAQTFFKEDGQCVYKGNPQVWYVGDNCPDEALIFNTRISLDQIFNIVAYPRVIAVLDRSSGYRELRKVAFPSELDVMNKVAFLGLPTDLESIDSGDVKSVYLSEASSSGNFLRLLYLTCNKSLDALWDGMRKIVRNNLLVSLKASLFYDEMGYLPKSIHELDEYSRPLENSLHRICSAIRDTILKSEAGPDLFRHCSIDVTVKNALDYITALTLSSLYYCESSKADALKKLRSQFYDGLLAAVRAKFHYSPPGRPAGTSENIRMEIQVLLRYLRERPYIVGELWDPEMEEKIINDFLAEHGNDFFNSLMPDSPSRNR